MLTANKNVFIRPPLPTEVSQHGNCQSSPVSLLAPSPSAWSLFYLCLE